MAAYNMWQYRSVHILLVIYTIYFLVSMNFKISAKITFQTLTLPLLLSGITRRLNSGLETLLDWRCHDCDGAADIAMAIESVEEMSEVCCSFTKYYLCVPGTDWPMFKGIKQFLEMGITTMSRPYMSVATY